MSLLEKAMGVRMGRLARGRLTDDELELLVAYLNGAIDATQVSAAMSFARQNVEPWAARKAREAIADRRLQLKVAK